MRKERNIDRTTVEKRAAQEEAAARIAAARQPKKMTNVRRLKWRRKLREEAFPGPDWLKPS